MNRKCFKRLKKSRDDSDILFYHYMSDGNVVTHSTLERREMTCFLKETLEQYIDKEKIALWT